MKPPALENFLEAGLDNLLRTSFLLVDVTELPVANSQEMSSRAKVPPAHSEFKYFATLNKNSYRISSLTLHLHDPSQECN